MGLNIDIGCITEQGDLGLGFDVLNEKDQSIYQQNENNQDTDKDDKNNK